MSKFVHAVLNSLFTMWRCFCTTQQPEELQEVGRQNVPSSLAKERDLATTRDSPTTPELIRLVDALRQRMDGIETAVKGLAALPQPQLPQRRERDAAKAIAQVRGDIFALFLALLPNLW